MDTKQLRTFLTLAKEKTYVKTSVVLNYAPSTLYNQITKLEEELGAQLFQTIDRQSVLTEAGKAFLPYAQDILDTSTKALASVRNCKDGLRGTLTITAMDSLNHKLTPLFTEYHSRYPDVIMHICSGNSVDMAQSIIDKKADIAFLYYAGEMAVNGVESWYLFYEPMPFCVSPGHRLAGKAEVGPNDLRHEVFFQQDDSSYNSQLQKLVKRENLQIKNNLQIVNGNLVRHYVSQGQGIAVLPQSMVDRDLSTNRLVKLNWIGKPLGINGIMLARDDGKRSPVVEEFINFTKHYYGRE